MVNSGITSETFVPLRVGARGGKLAVVEGEATSEGASGREGTTVVAAASVLLNVVGDEGVEVSSW